MKSWLGALDEVMAIIRFWVIVAMVLAAAWTLGVPALGKAWNWLGNRFPVQIHIVIAPASKPPG